MFLNYAALMVATNITEEFSASSGNTPSRHLGSIVMIYSVYDTRNAIDVQALRVCYHISSMIEIVPLSLRIFQTNELRHQYHLQYNLKAII